MRLRHRTILATLLLASTTLGCGDDENPTAANSPCLDANTECFSISLPPSGMEFYEFYMDEPPFPPTTNFGGRWPGNGEVIVGYAPGKRMIVSVAFSTPLRVRYAVPLASMTLFAGIPGSSDRFASLTPETDVDGNWATSQSAAYFEGDNSGSSRVELSITFENLEAGQSLRGVMWTFTVPDTYTLGGGAGSPILPADLDVLATLWTTTVDGDERGNPPIWPGVFP